MNRKEENQKLEEAALALFMEARNFAGEVRKREKPDFDIKTKNGKTYGIEITHLYGEGEASALLDRKPISDVETTEDLIEILNKRLIKKAEQAQGYDKKDKMILVIRIGSFMIEKRDIERLSNKIRVPKNSFDEVSLLIHNPDNENWSDLLQLK